MRPASVPLNRITPTTNACNEPLNASVRFKLFLLIAASSERLFGCSLNKITVTEILLLKRHSFDIEISCGIIIATDNNLTTFIPS